MGEKNGKVIAGGRAQGNRLDQLYYPTNILIDKVTNSLFIADGGNGRIVRWFRCERTTQGEIIIDNIDCYGLTLDHQRYLYVSDTEKHEIRRYTIGDKNGVVIAGENGEGNQLNQLNCSTYLFVDEKRAVYVSDFDNHRVMKLNKGEKEGIMIARGQGQGNGLIQLYDRGLLVDSSGILYVADHYHRHVVCSSKVLLQDTVIVSIAPCDCKMRAIVENVYSIQYSSSLSTDSLSFCDFAS